MHLELWGPREAALITLVPPRMVIGRDASNDIAVPSDPQMSRLHAVVEHFPSGWCLRDMSSSNGTFVNGEPVVADRPLRSGDEIRVGSTRLVYRTASHRDEARETARGQPPPDLTRRERDVLIALLRPRSSDAVFSEPASTREISAALYVSEAAVKQHLLHLYDKFGIYGDRRRVRLANEAVRRGVVTLAELRATQT